jgi:hypothetical protein
MKTEEDLDVLAGGVEEHGPRGPVLRIVREGLETLEILEGGVVREGVEFPGDNVIEVVLALIVPDLPGGIEYACRVAAVLELECVAYLEVDAVPIGVIGLPLSIDCTTDLISFESASLYFAS